MMSSPARSISRMAVSAASSNISSSGRAGSLPSREVLDEPVARGGA
jgi:hypothetical protein